ncbi:MAG TPA: ATP-grasp fold amidoligase family protein [Solirubrobacterales bacterium]|nr:ATP-grasp fold amidoligase family protein [Solirubrobacterales bacterium]
MAPATFTERLGRRRELWWDPPWPWRDRTLRDAAHRLRERRVFRTRDEADAAWRCCAAWPRTLLNKWNGREFAARHGCEVPDLLWFGSDHDEAPLESLPDRFVIRPAFGANRRGVSVVVDGTELLGDHPVTPSDLGRMLPRAGRLRRPAPVLIEEFIGTEEGRPALPLECKCHTFAGDVAAVEIVARRRAHEAKHRFYTPGWEPIADPMNTYLPTADGKFERPACLEEMVESASRLGAELGTYMRIDFFIAPRGCVFNEFASLPLRGQANTPYCDELFGGLWESRHGDAT